MNSFIKKRCWQQDLNKRESIIGIIQACLVMVSIAIVFYRALIAVPFLIPVGMIYFKSYRSELMAKKQRLYRSEFKDMIQLLSSNLSVGYGITNAFVEVERELRATTKKETRMVKELGIIIRQLNMNLSVEAALMTFANRVKLEDAFSFVTVFVSAGRSGGNLVDIISDTTMQIVEKQEVEKEIETILTAKKYEFRVMSMIPFFIIGYMSVSFGNFMSPLYGNILGIGVMTLCLVIYIFAYALGLKIVTIEI
ncbi:MAG: type II secretion system F family protein [Suipraeoptans sp.]